MNNSIYLVGCEDVRAGGFAAERGGDSMRAAADTMAEALNRHTRALEDHQIFLRDWLADYERITKAGADRNPPHGFGPR